MGNAPDVSLKRRVHILSEAQLRTYTLTGTIPDCKDHGHASREEAEHKLCWRLVRRVTDRICVTRTWQEPSRSRMREFSGWAVINRWREPVTQLITAERST